MSDYEDINLSREQLGDLLEIGDVQHGISLIDDTNLEELGEVEKLNEILERYPEGLLNIIKGYLEYCAEVISSRAIPAIDGLKPVQRRILVTLLELKLKDKTKSSKIAGAVMKYHPHSDSPIYEAMTRLTDCRGMMNVPLLAGKGTFGDVYSNKKASAARYTECELHPYASEFFGQIHGIEYMLNYDNTEKEPILLPVSFPNILINPTQGIAVGIASNIPSFNPTDVINLAIEYLRDGECSTVIMPDHRCGSIYVRNDRELMKLMKTGRARLRFRARAEISGKEIHFKELPFGVTKEALKKEIIELDLSGVEVKDLSDRGGLDLAVYCRSAAMANNVLMTLYKLTNAQYDVTANITVIINGEPKQLGVWGIIEEWCKTRCGQFKKEFEYQISVLRSKARVSDIKVEYLSKTEIVTNVIEMLRMSKKKEARQYIMDNIQGITPDEAKILTGIPTDRLGDKEDFRSEGAQFHYDIDKYKEKINSLSSVVIEDLTRVRGSFISIKRSTEVTDVDYDFSDDKEQVVIDDAPCRIAFKDNFIWKLPMTAYYSDTKFDTVQNFKANDTLIAVDNSGRVLRVYLSQIEYNSSDDVGTYLPKYWEIDDKDFDIVWMDLLDGSCKTVIYADGKIGFLDTSEWYGNKRQVKVIEKGISEYANQIVDVIDESEAVLAVTEQGRMSICILDVVFGDKRPSRTARKSVYKLPDGDRISRAIPMTQMEVYYKIRNSQNYLSPKVKFLESSNDILDQSLFE